MGKLTNDFFIKEDNKIWLCVMIHNPLKIDTQFKTLKNKTEKVILFQYYGTR